ncbi:MAG: alcohol dehydrogenase catalytic domain-containing protein [Bacteroidetes bacterium]|jgi:putative phosphonate catabolism associated alcohol dehydrogenase|nr:alcohol dehydrogenase catalytic domain-containing protein [Bacteroidota bacterium]
MEKTSKAAVFCGINQPFNIRKFTIPSLAQGEVLVKIKYTSVCGSDIHSWRGVRQEKYPSVLGHEIIGEVVDSQGHLFAYNSTIAIRPGDLITWALYAHCGTCDHCQKGLPQKCRNLHKYGHEMINKDNALSGGYAEYILLKKNTPLFKIPTDLDPVLATPLNCAYATIAGAMRLAGNCKHNNVLVIGSGMLGLVAAKWAETENAMNIAIIDKNHARLNKLNNMLMASTYLLKEDYQSMHDLTAWLNRYEGFDICIETSGKPQAVEFGFESLRLAGRLIVVGSVYPQANISISAEKLLRKLIRIEGIHNYTPDDLQQAIHFLQQSDLKKHKNYIFHETIFTLQSINEAFQTQISEKPFRTLIEP